MKKTFFILLTAFLVTAMVFLVLEGGLRGFYYLTKGPDYGIQQIKSDLQFDKLFGVGAQPNCDWFSSLTAHPNHGFIHHDTPPCGWAMSNTLTFGARLPETKDSHYVIMVLGGSVAQHIASSTPGIARNRIEDELNRRYQSPTGKPFRVVSGAMASWKHPNQMLKLLEFVDRIDAFISVEGYNEAATIRASYKLETPGLPYFMLTKVPGTDVLSIYVLEFYKLLLERYAILGNSFFFTKFYLTLRNILGPGILQSIEESYLMSTFKYPPGMPPAERTEKGLAKYVDYVRALDGIGFAHKKPAVLFIQPMPGLYKKLHPKEWPSRQGVPADLYLTVEKMLLGQKFLNLQVHSLLKIYENHEGFIYVDETHAEFIHPTGESPGYDIMARNIADALGQRWKLKLKKTK
jgi:hypothetical protein